MARCPISIVDMYVMPNKASADSFLDTLHNCHSSVKFTMDVGNNSFKVGTHEGTSRRDRSQGPVPGTNSHRVNRPIFVKNPVAGTEFWSPKSVPRIQTGLNSWDQSQGLVPAIFCLVPRVNRFVGLVPATY